MWRGPWGACVADDEELQPATLVRLLRERDKDVPLSIPSTELGTAILEGLLFCCHSEGRSQVSPVSLPTSSIRFGRNGRGPADDTRIGGLEIANAEAFPRSRSTVPVKDSDLTDPVRAPDS